jgi:hypothetical protein
MYAGRRAESWWSPSFGDCTLRLELHGVLHSNKLECNTPPVGMLWYEWREQMLKCYRICSLAGRHAGAIIVPLFTHRVQLRNFVGGSEVARARRIRFVTLFSHA